MKEILFYIAILLVAWFMAYLVYKRQKQYVKFMNLRRGDPVKLPLYCLNNRICYVTGIVVHKSTDTVTAIIDKNTIETPHLCDKSCCSTLQRITESWRNIEV